MPWPAFLQPVHRVVNPVAMAAAGRVGSLAVLEHRGRRSGRAYRTPVRAFRRGTVVAIGANFGAASDWVRNVLDAGGCEVMLRRRRLHLVEPRLVALADLPPVFPWWYRAGLQHLVRTQECLVLRVAAQP